MSFLKTYLSYFALILMLWHNTVYAHKPSDSYLTIHINNQTSTAKKSQAIDTNNLLTGNLLTGQWDIALRDLDFAIGLDTNANSEITWQEVETKQADIFAYALARLTLKNNQQKCSITPQQMLVDTHTDGAYAVIKLMIDCPTAVNKLTIDYALFSNIDPSHRGLLKINYVETDKNNTAKTIAKTAIFGPDNPSQTFAIGTPNRLIEFKEYVLEGVWHIWIGFDHILFLISLLLPAVLVYSAKKWQAQQSFKTTFLDVLKVVTAFTIAHSITLTMATLQVVELPSRWVEATIAASVILAALNNLFPLFTKNRWTVAFVFGLIHGFGFAAVLADLGLQQGTLIVALIGFNVGVEIGQVAILMAFVPLAFAIRKTWFYKKVIFYGGSVAIALIASVWLAERAFNLSIFF